MLKVSGIVRLGADPELKYLPDGTPILNLRAAANGSKKDAPPTWLSCSLFGKRAESLAPHLHKGDALVIYGTLSTREYESKGEKRMAVEVRLDDIDFAGGKKEDRPAPAAGGGGGFGGSRREPAQQGFDNDDVPFIYLETRWDRP
jgi:single-strand DNA-binding protein